MNQTQALLPEAHRPRPGVTEFLSRFIPQVRGFRARPRRLSQPRVSGFLSKLIPKPLLFALVPSEASFANEAPHVIDTRARVPAPPELVYDEFSECKHAHEWLRFFERFDSLTPGEPLDRRINEETFLFMKLRLRMLEAERGKHWVCSIDSSSLPFARQILEDVTFEPAADGGTDFHWRIYYRPSWLARPFHRMLRPVIDRLFRRNTAGLARFFGEQRLIPQGGG
jgi:polyketide cyclase/dehydrase/lipid transport protein